ncbi:unnamed protein product, partial [marine sediment metagenome]
MNKATDHPIKFDGLIRRPLTEEQKRRNKKARDRYQHRYGSGLAEKRVRKHT